MMGHEPIVGGNMNPATSAKSNTRASGYHQKALAEIRNSLLPFANGGTSSSDNYSSAASTISTISTTSGVSSSSNLSNNSIGLEKDLSTARQKLSQLINMGYTEELALKALKFGNGRYEVDVEILKQHLSVSEICNGFEKPRNGVIYPIGQNGTRKVSLDHELNTHRSSPAATMDSGAGSSRSDSPRQCTDMLTHLHLARQYSPNNFSDSPPLPPPRNSSTPPPPPPPHAYCNVPSGMQQMLKRMSPGPVVPLKSSTPFLTINGSQSSRQPMVIQNGARVQQQLTQQIQALHLYQNTPNVIESPPPYPVVSSPHPPSYAASIQSRQSPTQHDYRKSPSSGVYSASTGSASPTSSVSYNSSVTRPAPVPGWSVRQTKTQQPIIMQSVKSTQVQKPVLQTAVAPTVPSTTTTNPPLPSYASSMQHKQQCQKIVPSPHQATAPVITLPVSIPTTEPPSYACTMQALAVQRAVNSSPHSRGEVVSSVQRKFSSESRSDSTTSTLSAESKTPSLPPTNSFAVNGVHNGTDKPYKIDHQSPIPERKHVSKEKEEEQGDCKVRNYSPQAFKFFMEQHVENVLKSHKQRMFRRMQLETEMAKIGLSPEAQFQMRRMLSQKESNYIRLKRAKMDKSMFTKIKPIGVGAFGEVTLVRKIDTNHLYAMKTLRKSDVLQRNQVAHVKAERDILAEADNEWVVKLYYSFQDKDNLYFVMDYIPGGDLMSLLIKFGILEEPLARFYLAELVCAVESVHKMGFIHRDIKPDNILIDRDGHIKLTDFGLCTGFRWTHNSKYYQRNGEHDRQDSMDLIDDWNNSAECKCYQKPLERRRKREQHQRCLAHSLVGTPNYIAPEVLERTGYTQLCDWWSVGVILYEMIVGSPPFLANTPAETQHKIIKWRETLKIPLRANVSPEAADLIMKLCTSPDRRLGRNANDIRKHPFFANINYNEGVRRLTPPFMPKIQYSTDTSNFDPIDPEKLQNSISNDSDISDDKLFHGFFEFTFRRFFDEGGGVPFPTRINLDENENQGAVYV